MHMPMLEPPQTSGPTTDMRSESSDRWATRGEDLESTGSGGRASSQAPRLVKLERIEGAAGRIARGRGPVHEDAAPYQMQRRGIGCKRRGIGRKRRGIGRKRRGFGRSGRSGRQPRAAGLAGILFFGALHRRGLRVLLGGHRHELHGGGRLPVRGRRLVRALLAGRDCEARLRVRVGPVLGLVGADEEPVADAAEQKGRRDDGEEEELRPSGAARFQSRESILK